ncbi:MAG: hypothetical protein Q8Q31_04770 [Nanoarchaeota archaeon]|nr:hypothetical protein [Nanoarchaeota archaeon]
MSYKDVDRGRLGEFDKLRRGQKRTRESVRGELEEEGKGDRYAGYVVKRYLSHDLPGGGITPEEQGYISENFNLLRKSIPDKKEQQQAAKRYAHLLTLPDLTQLAHEYGSDGRVMAVRQVIIGRILNYTREHHPNAEKLKKIAHLLSSEYARKAISAGEGAEVHRARAGYLFDLATESSPEKFYGICKKMAERPQENPRPSNLDLTQRVQLVISFGALLIGVFFLLPSITGNVIVNSIGKKISMIGTTLIIIGLISASLYIKSKKSS